MVINGKQMDFETEITISEMLKKLDLSEEKVVVEVNFKISSKEKYKEYVLNQSDKVEIVSFVGGGWFANFFEWKKLYCKRKD